MGQQVKLAEVNVVDLPCDLESADIKAFANHNIGPRRLEISAMKLALKVLIPAPDLSHVKPERLLLHLVAKLGIRLRCGPQMYKMWFHIDKIIRQPLASGCKYL